MTTTITSATYTVASGATISVSSGPALYADIPTSVTVYGSVSGVTAGIYLRSTGSITNSGNIVGDTAITIDGAGFLSNSGDITGSLGSGIYITGGGVVVNSGVMAEDPTDSYTGSHGGVINILGLATVTNSGTIISNATNGDAGLSFASTGISIGQGTVTNAGTIIGAQGVAVTIANGAGNDRFIADPGQVVVGKVIATGTNNILELASSATAGTLVNPGNYIDFQTLIVDSGADWKIGTSGATQTLSGIGTIDNAGTLILAGSIVTTAGTGAPVINMGGTGAGSELELTPTALPNGSVFADSITNFGSSDSVLLTGFTLPAGDELVYDYNNGTLSVAAFNPNNSTTGDSETFRLSGPGGFLPNDNGVAPLGVSTDGLTFTTLAGGGLLITDTPCFAAGTRILTPDGEVPVEDIKAGDIVMTSRPGFTGVAEVIWVGQRTVDLKRHAMPEKVLPVRILAGAFGPGLPQRDLRLSPDHALYIDRHLIEAKTLVNGVTVIVETASRFVTYHHIELAAHDLVLAEGLPAETYLESGNRAMFENGAAPLVLHPDFVTSRRTAACAPLLTEGEIVTRIRQRLLDRAVALGFTVTTETDLQLEADGQKIRAKAGPQGTWLFTLPEGATQVRLLSPTGAPANVTADPRDRRTLGVNLAGLALLTPTGRTTIPLENPAHQGLHALETGHRWTNGAALLALPPHTGPATLEVTIAGQAARWVVAA
jgi:hypothetical protein